MSQLNSTREAMLPSPLRERVELLLLGRAVRGERALSVARGVFCVLVLLRFLALSGGMRPAGLIALPALSGGVAFSVWTLLRRSDADAAPLLRAAGGVDAAVCFAALLPNILWPWEGYRGLLMCPDITAVLLVVCASGVRLNPRSAALSGFFNACASAALVGLDFWLRGPQLEYEAHHVALWALLLGAATWIATATARQGLELALQGALESIHGALAHQNLRVLLEGHHDARTLLSSATLHGDLLAQRIEAVEASPARHACAELAFALRSDLAELNRFARSIKSHAFSAVASLETLSEADAHAAYASVATLVQRLFPQVEFCMTGAADTPAVLAMGGKEALGRAVMNLLVNACEGDGQQGASRVHVVVAAPPSAAFVSVHVQDNGPGFPRHLLERGVQRASTTKTAGSGLGLHLVRNFVEASGGTLRLANRPEGGAEVELRLPRIEGF